MRYYRTNGSGGSAIVPTFTGASDVTLGGITEGQVFSNTPLNLMWSTLLSLEKYPTLISPFGSFTSDAPLLAEIGGSLSINFTASFNRGAITPQYTSATPYRSGDPVNYIYTGALLAGTTTTNALSDSKSIANYIVALGPQSWSVKIHHLQGPQPKTNHNNNYDVPYPEGDVGPYTITITGVYPIFATTSDITQLTKQALVSHTATYYAVTMAAESGGNKQKIAISDAHNPITGVQFFNTVSGQWEWINGSKANSLLSFNVSSTQININGNLVDYTVLTNNGATVGSRQMRFYTN